MGENGVAGVATARGVGATGRGPLNVLHVKGSVDARMGGSVTALGSIASATALAGDRVTVLATYAPGDDVDGFRSLAGVELVLTERQQPRQYAFSLPLLRYLLRYARTFDVVEVHEIFAFPTAAAWLACTLRRVPLVVHPHNSLDPYDLRKHEKLKRGLRPAVRRLLRTARAVWATAGREADRIDAHGATVERIVTPLPVPAPSAAGDGAAFRERIGSGPGDPVVLFLGRFDRKKGIDRLIEAFGELASEEPRARLVVAGMGTEDEVRRVERLVAASPAADRIALPGYVSGVDREAAFAAADLFVLHSDNENFGLAVVEALHHGVPVLLSDEVFIAEDLAAAGAAVVVPVDDRAGLARRLRLLLTGDRCELRRLASHATAAAAPFLPEVVAETDARVRRDLLLRGT